MKRLISYSFYIFNGIGDSYEKTVKGLVFVTYTDEKEINDKLVAYISKKYIALMIGDLTYEIIEEI